MFSNLGMASGMQWGHSFEADNMFGVGATANKGAAAAAGPTAAVVGSADDNTCRKGGQVETEAA